MKEENKIVGVRSSPIIKLNEIIFTEDETYYNVYLGINSIDAQGLAKTVLSKFIKDNNLQGEPVYAYDFKNKTVHGAKSWYTVCCYNVYRNTERTPENGMLANNDDDSTYEQIFWYRVIKPSKKETR